MSANQEFSTFTNRLQHIITLLCKERDELLLKVKKMEEEKKMQESIALESKNTILKLNAKIDELPTEFTDHWIYESSYEWWCTKEKMLKINKIRDGIRQVRTNPSLRCVGICTWKSEGRAGKQCKCKGYIGADGQTRCIFHRGAEENDDESENEESDEEDDSNSDWNSGDDDSDDEACDRETRIDMVIAGIYEVRKDPSLQCTAITQKGTQCKCVLNAKMYDSSVIRYNI